jgi:hypothetical protein
LDISNDADASWEYKIDGRPTWLMAISSCGRSLSFSNLFIICLAAAKLAIDGLKFDIYTKIHSALQGIEKKEVGSGTGQRFSDA